MMAQMMEFHTELKSDARQTHHNMSLYQTLSADEAPVDFRTLDNALATDEEGKSVSPGNDLRLESERFTGAGLKFEDQIIQFSLFGSENGNGSSPQGWMRKASARRESQMIAIAVVGIPYTMTISDARCSGYSRIWAIPASLQTAKKKVN